MAKIKNINGLSEPLRATKKLLTHWEVLSDKKANFCAEKNCIEKELFGVPVQKVRDNHNWYIVPLCKYHSSANGELDIEGCTVFIPKPALIEPSEARQEAPRLSSNFKTINNVS